MSTPADRRTIARIAANTRWANEPDRTAAMANARNNSPASVEYWMKKIDPGKALPYTERVKRAENAKTAYYQKAMLKARQAKAAKRTGQAA